MKKTFLYLPAVALAFSILTPVMYANIPGGEEDIPTIKPSFIAHDAGLGHMVAPELEEQEIHPTSYSKVQSDGHSKVLEESENDEALSGSAPSITQAEPNTSEETDEQANARRKVFETEEAIELLKDISWLLQEIESKAGILGFIDPRCAAASKTAKIFHTALNSEFEEAFGNVTKEVTIIGVLNVTAYACSMEEGIAKGLRSAMRTDEFVKEPIKKSAENFAARFANLTTEKIKQFSARLLNKIKFSDSPSDEPSKESPGNQKLRELKEKIASSYKSFMGGAKKAARAVATNVGAAYRKAKIIFGFKKTKTTEDVAPIVTAVI